MSNAETRAMSEPLAPPWGWRGRGAGRQELLQEPLREGRLQGGAGAEATAQLGHGWCGGQAGGGDRARAVEQLRLNAGIREGAAHSRAERELAPHQDGDAQATVQSATLQLDVDAGSVVGAPGS